MSGALDDAVLHVLAGAGRLVTRGELAQADIVRRVRRDRGAIRAAVNRLIAAGLVSEPRGKGQGVEITDAGRHRRAA